MRSVAGMCLCSGTSNSPKMRSVRQIPIARATNIGDDGHLEPGVAISKLSFLFLEYHITTNLWMLGDRLRTSSNKGWIGKAQEGIGRRIVEV